MPTKLIAHRGEHLLGKAVFLARAKARVERCRQNFGRYGLFQGGGPGSVLFATGLRLQQEPRGFYLVTQGVISFFDTPYSTNGANYSFGQTEVSVRLMAGYYFRKPLYNE